MRGKRVQFDDETWNALDLLARDRMQVVAQACQANHVKAALRQSVKNAGSIAGMPDFVKRPVLPSVRVGPSIPFLGGPRPPAIVRNEAQRGTAQAGVGSWLL
jgi:hypothetical protein